MPTEVYAQYSYSTTRFDRWIDNINRLPRPIMVITVIVYLLMAVFKPDTFNAVNEALRMIPDPINTLLGGIIGFYFVGREAHHFRQARMANNSIMPESVRRGLESIGGGATPAKPATPAPTELADRLKPKNAGRD